MSDQHQREVAVFEAALQLPLEQRESYLLQTCAGDPDLLQRIRALLKAEENPSDFLAPAASDARPEQTSLHPPTEKPGDSIGPYKLLQQIGEGGCGVVYMAEQEKPLRRRVAFKIIKLGMDTRQVVARFEAERQALALMDHPNIAKVHDAGATETGRPYFVMELVRGIKITDFCDEKTLSTRRRLELFIQVCQAVQHAHQKGIIHRDLKPSNILVTVNDGVAVPKVIDFGIAKATTGERLTDKTVFTAFEQFIGTPAYMSPEQAEITSVDIDTRSDIYSLGVLLYELLTGQTPFDIKDLLKAGFDEMRRTIREKEPACPSTRLSTLGAQELTTAAQRRGLEAPKLVSIVRGDLDWIVMKCLEKDRSRRYETANGLAMDLQRHLDNEPVLASPPSGWYRFRKLLGRNKLIFGAVGGITAALMAGVVASTWETVRARHAEREQSRLLRQAEEARAAAQASQKKAETEAAKSDAVGQFFDDMLQGVGPEAAKGRDTTILKEIMDRTARSIGQLTNQPEVEAEIRFRLGAVYRALGDYKASELMLGRTVSLMRQTHPGGHLDLARSLNDLAKTLIENEKYSAAEAAVLEAIEICRKLGDSESLEMASFKETFGRAQERTGKLTEAEAAEQEALTITKKFLGDENKAVTDVLAELAEIRLDQKRLSDAEDLFRQILTTDKKILGDEDLPRDLDNLATTLDLEDKAPEA